MTELTMLLMLSLLIQHMCVDCNAVTLPSMNFQISDNSFHFDIAPNPF